MAIEINLFDSTATSYINQGESSISASGYIVENGKNTDYDKASTGYKAINTARNDIVFGKARTESNINGTVEVGSAISQATAINKNVDGSTNKAYQGFRYLDDSQSAPDNSSLITMSNDTITNGEDKYSLVGKNTKEDGDLKDYYNIGANLGTNGKGENNINIDGDGPAATAYNGVGRGDTSAKLADDWVASSMGAGDSDKDKNLYETSDNGTLSATVNIVNAGHYGYNYRGGGTLSNDGNVETDASDWMSSTYSNKDSYTKALEAAESAGDELTKGEKETEEEFAERQAQKVKEEKAKVDAAHNAAILADKKPNSAWVNDISKGRGYTPTT